MGVVLRLRLLGGQDLGFLPQPRVTTRLSPSHRVRWLGLPEDCGDSLPGGLHCGADGPLRRRLRHPALALAAADRVPAYFFVPLVLLVTLSLGVLGGGAWVGFGAVSKGRVLCTAGAQCPHTTCAVWAMLALPWQPSGLLHWNHCS